MAAGDNTGGPAGGEPPTAADFQRLWDARERAVNRLLERDELTLFEEQSSEEWP